MGNEDDKDPQDQYPPEFEYLNEIVGEKTSQLQLINKQIADMPKTPPDTPRLQYNQPALGKAIHDRQNMKSLNNLENMRDKLNKEVNDRVEAEIRGVDPEIADHIRAVTLEKISPNLFKGKSDKELDTIKLMQKDMNHSQNYMMVRMKNERDKQRQAPSVPVPQVTEIRKEKAPEKPKSYAAERFSLSLNYTQKVNFTDPNPEKKTNPSKPKTGPDKD